MKSLFSALIAFAVLSITSLAAPAPQGFIIYTDPPSTYVNGAEFTAYANSNSAYSTITRTDGASEQVWNSGIIGIVYYPTGQSSEAEATQELQYIQGLQRKFPQPEFRAYLLGAYAKWQNALALSRQQRQQAPAARTNLPDSNNATLSLDVNGTKYDDVKLTGVDDDSASIMHNAGVARIPLAALNKEQISALNGTTASVRIAPDWLEKRRAKEKKADETMRLTLNAEKSKETEEAPEERIDTSPDEAGDLVKVKAILSSHPDFVFGKDKKNGMTPLHLASVRGERDVAELLLANKSDINAKDNKGMTPLHWAAIAGYREVAELLLTKGADIEAKDDNNGFTPLHMAAAAGRREVVKLLLVNNANADAISNNGWTALHFAADSGYKDVAALLLANKADIDAKDHDGMTPLLRAAAKGHRNVAELLLTNGADINAKDAKYGATSLHFAADSDFKDVAALLLANKADIDAKDHDGMTPLHFAAGSGYKDVAELLLGNGAEVNAIDNDNDTPLGVATLKKREDMVELLRQHGGHE